jgi:hypothetical protein
MKNKLLLAGAIAVAGFIGLTAFGGTKAEQDAQIKSAVEAKLAAYTTELQDACAARVEAEAQTRFDAVRAERAAAEAAKPAAPGKKPATKPKGSKGPKVDPLPQPTKPTSTGTERPGATKKDEPATPVSRPGAVKKDEAPTPVSRPGAVKKEGGGGK